MAQIIDGKAIAKKIRDGLSEDIRNLKQRYNLTPGLAIVQVGEREDSTVYVRMKERAAKEAGMNFFMKKLPETTKQVQLLSLIQSLNEDSSVHGILVQLPLPSHIDERIVTEAIDARKDVDGCVNSFLLFGVNTFFIVSIRSTLASSPPRARRPTLFPARPPA